MTAVGILSAVIAVLIVVAVNAHVAWWVVLRQRDALRTQLAEIARRAEEQDGAL